MLRLVRRSLGLTQAEVGQRCGYSAATISRFETGARPFTDPEVIRAVARALQIPESLFGLAPPPSPVTVRSPVADALAVLRAASVNKVVAVPPGPAEDGDDVRRRNLLAGLTGVTGAAVLGPQLPAAANAPVSLKTRLEQVLYGDHTGARLLSVAELGTARAKAWSLFEACRYDELAERLPALAAAAQAGRAAASSRTRDRLAVAMADTYVLTCELAVKAGDDGMAWAAADRALAAARDSGDPAATAAASRAVAMAMRRHGHFDGATNLLTTSALSLGADRGEPGDGLLAAYGAMLCTAAYSSAQHGQRAQALDLIEEAGKAADRMTTPRRTGSGPFSAANVGVYRIGIHTVLGEPGVALEHARRVDIAELPSPERHARYCIDTARAWEQFGRTDRAFEALRAAERHAPEEIRRPSVRTLISTMLYAPGATPEGLRAMAARAGAPV
ncbi:helix-turn-helix domain-containing protein [Thermomonospora umbrina]|uniref:helix-turn-helix domain-containing protein n=1 Tax=Thermomonospora umbrina TaxID=111806 RepID=UPI0014769D40|nr:helix-turn-helix transcriptional regulator [Thermomonospora umbrina]